MYAIMSGGELVDLCDEPRYIKQNDYGIYVTADAADAIGVSVKGDKYNINGGDAIPDAPQAVVVQRDGGEFVFNSCEQIKEDEAAIALIEDAICEMDAEAGRLSAVGGTAKAYSLAGVSNIAIGGMSEEVRSKIWAKRLIAGTRTWADVPAHRQSYVKAELAARVENGAITAEQYADITGEECPA